MPKSVLIKKYANRRLYDTEKSKYITVNQVAIMIRSGMQVTVKDAKTGEDVTDFILTQIVLEEAKKKNALLPSPVLHLIIQYGDNVLGEFFDKYFLQSIHNYVNAKGVFEEQFKKWIDLSVDMSGITKKTIKNPLKFKTFMDLFAGLDSKKK